jgi:hypothetical protein
VTGRLASAFTPKEQLVERLRQWMAGEPMAYGPCFHDMEPREDGVWELKTADLRMFGWMYRAREFIAVRGGYADHYKEPTKIRNYADERREVVRSRDALPLDARSMQREALMNSFQLEIDDKSRVGSMFMARVVNEIRRAAAIEKASRKITQQAIAEKIGTSRAVVNREMQGLENLSSRRIAELLWALGWEPHFEARKIPAGENLFTPTPAPPHVVFKTGAGGTQGTAEVSAKPARATVTG